MLFVLGILVTGGSVGYFCWNFFSGEIEGAAQNRLEQGKKETKNGLLKISRPFLRSFILPYSERMKIDDWRKKQKRMIVSAGLEDEVDPSELLALKIFLGFVVPTAFQLYFLANNSPLPLWLFLGTCLVGFMYPSIWISGSRKRRHEEIRLQLPFVIDLLTLSTEAGLDFIGALQKVVEKTKPGPLVNEIERMIQEIQLGTTRAEGLRNLAWRIDLQETSSLVAVLVTADQMGSSLGGVLRVQSELIRTQRFVTAEKRGAAASQKILFPLIFFIMPAVFIMIFGPVVLSFFGAGGR